MPDNSANLTTLRTDGGFIRAYLSVFVSAEVFRCTLNAVPTYPSLNWAVTAVSGSASNVKQGYRVDVYTAGGEYKGRTRIRYAGTISSTNLPVREHSRGIIPLAAGDSIRVFADVRLSDKLVSATNQFPPDGLAYVSQGSDPPPVACSGGPYAGWAANVPVSLPGGNSFAVDPDSGGSLTHLWSFPAGLTGSSTSAASPNITAATAGEYLISHTVTDSSNSKATVQLVPHKYHDANNLPYEVVIQAVEGDEETGHSFTVQVFENASLTQIPDGALCILWMDQTLAGSTQAFGVKTSGRSHILGCGYIRQEEGESSEGIESLTFRVISPLARLDELAGFSKVMISKVSPSKWREMKTLTTKRAIVQLAQFYTNLIESGFDLVFSSLYDNQEYPRITLQANTPLGQMREIAAGTDARLVADRTGRFEVHTRPELMAIDDRPAMTRTITLTTDDIISWRYTREHWRPVKMIEVQGFSSGSDPQPLFSRWAGKAPGQGSTSTTITKLIVDPTTSQADMNQRAGRHGAAADGIYVDTNGVLTEALDLDIVLPVGYHVADFYDELIDITLTSTLRGIDFSDQSYVLRNVSLELDENGAGQVRWTLRTATNGAAGATYTPKQKNVPTGITPPSTTPLTPPALPSLLPPWTSESDNKVPLGGLIVNASAAQAARFDSIDTVTGVISSTDISTGLSGSGMWAASDPYDYRRKFALTTAGLDKTDNFKSFSSWSAVATNTAMFGSSGRVGHKVITSINKRGWMMAMSHSMIAVSFDYGATWAVRDPGSMATYGTGTLVNATGDIYVSPHNSSASGNGWVYASIYVGVLNGNQYTCKIYLSTDWGLTWTLLGARFVSAGTIAPGCRIIVPYKDHNGAVNSNGNSQELYILEGRQGAGYVIRTTKSAITTGTTLYSVTSSTPYPVAMGQAPLNVFTNDGSYWYAGAGTGTTHGVVKGLNASGTLYNLSGPTSSIVNVNGWPMDPLVAITWVNQSSGTATNKASITFDGGVNWYHGVRPVGWTGNDTAYAELDLSDYIAPQ